MVKFTSKQVRRVHPDNEFRKVISPEGEYVCDVNDACICDINGQQIATFSHNEEIFENDEKLVISTYESRYGIFTVKGNYLYLNDKFLGHMRDKKRRLPFIILGILGVLLTVAIILIALIDLPYDEVPVIDVKDKNGAWKAQGTVAVLDEIIYPDSKGEYEFIIRNPNDVQLLYEFSIAEYYNGEAAESFPLEYRVRVNNYLIGSEEWLPASELHFENLRFVEDSSHVVTLEWRWRFESGNDELDTCFGKDGGRYTLELSLTAESISEIS